MRPADLAIRPATRVSIVSDPRHQGCRVPCASGFVSSFAGVAARDQRISAMFRSAGQAIAASILRSPPRSPYRQGGLPVSFSADAVQPGGGADRCASSLSRAEGSPVVFGTTKVPLREGDVAALHRRRPRRGRAPSSTSCHPARSRLIHRARLDEHACAEGDAARLARPRDALRSPPKRAAVCGVVLGDDDDPSVIHRGRRRTGHRCSSRRWDPDRPRSAGALGSSRIVPVLRRQGSEAPADRALAKAPAARARQWNSSSGRG